MLKLFNTYSFLALAAVSSLLVSCGDDDDAEPVKSAIADFSAQVDANDKSKVTFTNLSENATSVSWDFGDGSALSTEENPTHTYAAAGSYNVKLTATGADNKTSEKTSAVVIVDVLTEEKLNGSGAKAWKIKPAAGSFKVGPSKGSGEWWDAGNLAETRPCVANDEFIFKTGNVFQYDSKGDLWGEAYMGVTDGCMDEGALPAAASAWASGTHTFTFTPATASAPAYITVTGTGAFIALPKAYNGGEYAAAPPADGGSVKYEVTSYEKTGNTETITLSIDISAGQAGGAFWTFVLVSE